jgi:hypothetical protein
LPQNGADRLCLRSEEGITALEACRTCDDLKGLKVGLG